VELEHVLVDACAMHILRYPARFDVILAGNMFGDILSDEASVLAGSLGMLPSASLNAGAFGMYEPIHGSAPDIAGQGIANPSALILASCQMLSHLGMDDKAKAVRGAIRDTLAARDRTTPDVGGDGTTASMADALVERLTG
jgi:isocitrate/isopropylmalate dehydrogenase